MARSYGVLKISVWEPQSDFRQLTLTAQWAYTMLISQPQISNLGVLPYTPEKWRRLAAGLDQAELERALTELREHRYVLVDEDTGELLVRTFIKHDKVWSQPKLVMNARKLIREVESDEIRGYLLQRHPWLLEPWEKARIVVYEEAAEAPDQAESEPLTEGVPKGVSEGVSIPLSTPRARAGPGAGAGPGASSSSRSSTKDHSKRRAKTENDQEPAAAGNLDDTEPPTQAEVQAALDRLRSTDPGSFRVIEPIARQLPRSAFTDVLATVQERCNGGRVKNDAGLFHDLLKVTLQARQAAYAAADFVSVTPADEIESSARHYAINRYPWDVVQPLLERQAQRLAGNEQTPAELVELAQRAYDHVPAGAAP